MVSVKALYRLHDILNFRTNGFIQSEKKKLFSNVYLFYLFEGTDNVQATSVRIVRRFRVTNNPAIILFSSLQDDLVCRVMRVPVLFFGNHRIIDHWY